MTNEAARPRRCVARTIALGLISALALGWAAAAQSSEAVIEQVDTGDGDATIASSTEFDLFTSSEDLPDGQSDPFGVLLEQRPGASSSLVRQIGDDNVAAAEIRGANNRTAQIQYGADNESFISLLGDFNDAVTSQDGVGNSTAITVEGDNTSTATIQLGNGLSIAVDRIGSNGPPITLLQQGDN